MSSETVKFNKISQIVRIRQMLQRWRKKAATNRSQVPSDVPSGHVAIFVGSSHKRFIVRATYLNHPVFKRLLAEAEEEYGFKNQGPLMIPCDEALFEEVLGFLTRVGSGQASSDLPVHVQELRSCPSFHFNAEYWPFLSRFDANSVSFIFRPCMPLNDRFLVTGDASDEE
ncbi:Small auxin-up RNA [Dillenia turbinata]|uniref:Small auxin-up RNA n=1 Tax=Dillenia turbinata TaxID=194707 RepID=A0AAN8UH07_9MAGN